MKKTRRALHDSLHMASAPAVKLARCLGVTVFSVLELLMLEALVLYDVKFVEAIHLLDLGGDRTVTSQDLYQGSQSRSILEIHQVSR